MDFEGTPYLYPITANQKNIVKIKMTGSRKNDNKLAYELSGIKKDGMYTRHHLDDYNPLINTCTMQLVIKKVHRAAVPHYGSVELFKKILKVEKY